MSSTVELLSYLITCNLSNAEFWVSKLQSFGIHSVASLISHEGNESLLLQLADKAESISEKKTLWKIFNLNFSDYLPVTNLAAENLRIEERNVFSLLGRLGLTNYYHKKLQLQDARCIRPEILSLSLGETKLVDVKQLPLLVLHKIMSYDSSCRSDFMSRSSLSIRQSFCDESDSENGEYDTQNVNAISPVDVILALILCSDDFLRQELFSRLAKCQLAVPFLLPDPIRKQLTLPLWALSSIIKEWTCTLKDGTIVQTIKQTIVSYKMPLLSFIRLGKQRHGKSKSRILNEVISDSHYNHFFNRDCPGGQYKHILGEGLVDMCWYLPAGKPTDAFSGAVTFLNLHGDARQHSIQCRFLSRISSIFFILLSEEIPKLDRQIVEIFASTPGDIILLDDVGKQPTALKKVIPRAHIINLTKKNFSEIKDAIQHRITTKLNEMKNFQSIEQLCRIKQEEISVDKDSDNYKKGQVLANKIISMLTEYKAKSSAKEIMFPLQGEGLWRHWALLEKEFYRQNMIGKKTAHDYAHSLQSKKKSIREKQLLHIESLTPVMQSFIKSLLTLGGSLNKEVRNYFLQCLKLQLEYISRESVSKLQYQYQTSRKNLCLLESKLESEVITETKELHKLQESIKNSSFCLEELFRELSQVYEAAMESPDLKNNFFHLPRAAAELMIDGHPLELMDGDTTHVPLKWVSAVLTEAVKMLDNPKVFVLSVVGLKSTGKSTMLNTVFGLQFNVSTEKCIRGAFMQLLPIDAEFKHLMECDYVLVIDTEGLRAPQLGPLQTQKHDNELATFVIGLASMSLINIYGEVPGDIDDILQTSVHALLRMPQIKLSPSCQFVHQNAGASIISEVGRAKLTEKLNKFAIAAAKEESLEEKFKSFNDVIKFDDQTDIHCLPGLWKGDPPMAPLNYGYSNASQMLKKHLIHKLSKAKHSTSSKKFTSCLCLSSFQLHLTNTWISLLKENFEFSTLNSVAYDALKTAYSKWEWSFQEDMMNWELKAENEITTADANDVRALVKRKCKELELHVSTMHEKLRLKMQFFFEGSQSDILVQWRAGFETRLDDLATDLRVHAEEHCEMLGGKQNFTTWATAKVQTFIDNVKLEQEMFNKHLKEKKLESQELKKILDRNLFNPEKLVLFKNQKIIDEKQVKRLNNIIVRCNGQLSEQNLTEILVGGVLSTEQVKDVLKIAHQTDEELEDQFDAIWKEILCTLPRDITVAVESQIEFTLFEFARTNGSEGKLIQLLRDKSLRSYGEKLDLIPIEEVHFRKVTNFVERVSRRIMRSTMGVTVGPDQIEAYVITGKVFKAATKKLTFITKKATDFKTVYIKELQKTVDKKISVEEATVKQRFMFTAQYRLEVFLTACGYAIPQFETMSASFRTRKVKDHLLTQYKSLLRSENTGGLI